MKKIILTLALLIGGTFVVPTTVYADSVIYEYQFSATNPYDLSCVYLIQLTRDNNGNLYCYSRDENGNFTVKTRVYRVRGSQDEYYVHLYGQDYRFNLSYLLR